MAGLICDVYGKDDLSTQVVSSSLGAISFAYCDICWLIGAEPKWLVMGSYEDYGKSMHENLNLTYYDKETDSYIDIRKGDIPISFRDETEVKTRSEAIERSKNET